jgi:hypothetical protein
MKTEYALSAIKSSGLRKIKPNMDTISFVLILANIITIGAPTIISTGGDLSDQMDIGESATMESNG